MMPEETQALAECLRTGGSCTQELPTALAQVGSRSVPAGMSTRLYRVAQTEQLLYIVFHMHSY